jgi:peptide/nickel transport system ATP-binding protein
METIEATRLHESTHPYTRGLLNCQPKIDGSRDRLPTLQRDPAWLDPDFPMTPIR